MLWNSETESIQGLFRHAGMWGAGNTSVQRPTSDFGVLTAAPRGAVCTPPWPQHTPPSPLSLNSPSLLGTGGQVMSHTWDWTHAHTHIYTRTPTHPVLCTDVEQCAPAPERPGDRLPLIGKKLPISWGLYSRHPLVGNSTWICLERRNLLLQEPP